MVREETGASIAVMNYKKLNIVDFGRQLLRSGDLDPVYIILREETETRPELVRRFMLAYWCFYSCGAAAFLAERQHGFWNWVERAARNEQLAPQGDRWPRARERRHFRGPKCVAAVKWLAGEFPEPEAAAAAVEERGPEFKRIRDYIVTWPQFGPWIAFKVADMLETILGAKIDFTDADIFMYDAPKDAAVLLHSGLGSESGPPGGEVDWAVRYLDKHFGDRLAPPSQSRRVGLQEVETILCKWKAHMGGHYPINNDLREVGESLHRWGGVSPMALRLASHLPGIEG